MHSICIDVLFWYIISQIKSYTTIYSELFCLNFSIKKLVFIIFIILTFIIITFQIVSHIDHSLQNLVYTTQFWVLINKVQKAHRVYMSSALLYIPRLLKPSPTLWKETGTECEYAERVNEIAWASEWVNESEWDCRESEWDCKNIQPLWIRQLHKSFLQTKFCQIVLSAHVYVCLF